MHQCTKILPLRVNFYLENFFWNKYISLPTYTINNDLSNVKWLLDEYN